MSTKGTTGKAKNYYGSVGGVVCAGPVDELVSIMIDGTTVWPTKLGWADDVIDLGVVNYKRTANFAKLTCAGPHRLKIGDHIYVQNMADSSFDNLNAHTVSSKNDQTLKYSNTGANVGATDTSVGTLTKVVHYAVDTIVRYGSGMYKCILDHYGTPDKAPPNATYWVSYSLLRSTSANPVSITIPDFGQVWFYWGTDTQTLRSTSFLLKNGHPPYRRQALIEFERFLFGTERQAIPNVEVTTRRTPQQVILSGDPAALDEDFQANPLAIAAEFLTDPVFGIGQDASVADATSWQAIADELQAQNEFINISPMLDSVKTFREFIGLILAYYDGWLRYNISGKIEAGRFLHNEAPPSFTDATTIDFHDIVEEIEWDAEGWADTYNETICKFRDRIRAFKDAGQTWKSGFNRQITGEPRTAQIEREWITREAQALFQAAEYGKINAQQKLSGSLNVRAEKVASIKQGDLFLLTHDAVGLSIICRCTERMINEPPAGTIKLRFENERGIAPVPFRPTMPNPTFNQVADPELIEQYLFIQPPPALVGSEDFIVTVLASRASDIARGYRVWLQKDDASLFYELGSQRNFAIRGLLTQAYALPSAKTTEERSRTSNVATIKSTAHGYLTGYYVDIDSMGDTSYNVTSVAITVTDANHFTYASVGSNEGTVADTGGNISPAHNDDSENLQLDFDEYTVQADLDRMTASQSVDAINDNALLAFIFDAADPTNYELATIKAIRLDTVYKLKVVRGRFSTHRRAASTNDIVWIIYRADVVGYTQEKFADYAANGTAATFRLQSFTGDADADLADPDLCPDISFTFTDPWAPQVTWTSLQANAIAIVFSAATVERTRASNVATLKVTAHGLTTGNLVNITGFSGGASGFNASAVSVTVTDADHFTYPNTGSNSGLTADATGLMTRIFKPTDTFTFSFQMTDANADLNYGALVARLGSVEQTLWSSTLAESSTQSKIVSFALATEGHWRIFGVVGDATGRIKEYELKAIGGSIVAMDIQSAASAGTITQTPVADPPGTSYPSTQHVTLTCSTASATIKYSKVAYGAAPGAYSTYTGAITITLVGSSSKWTLYAYATHAGLTDSSVVRNDYTWESGL